MFECQSFCKLPHVPLQMAMKRQTKKNKNEREKRRRRRRSENIKLSHNNNCIIGQIHFCLFNPKFRIYMSEASNKRIRISGHFHFSRSIALPMIRYERKIKTYIIRKSKIVVVIFTIGQWNLA